MADTTEKDQGSPVGEIFSIFSCNKKEDIQSDYHHVPTHAAAAHEKTTAKLTFSNRVEPAQERFYPVSEGQSATAPAESAVGKDADA
jgi:hypothetical protein